MQEADNLSGNHPIKRGDDRITMNCWSALNKALLPDSLFEANGKAALEEHGKLLKALSETTCPHLQMAMAGRISHYLFFAEQASDRAKWLYDQGIVSVFMNNLQRAGFSAYIKTDDVAEI